MRRSFIPCLALIFTCAAASAQPATQPAEKPLGVKIGVTEITIPAPHGFVHMSKAPSQIQSSFEMMTPQTNRFLGGFLLPSATVIPESGVTPPLDQYMLVQTLRAIEGIDVSAEDFKMVKDELARSQDQMFAQKKEEFNERLKALAAKGEVGADIQLGEPVMLGTFVNKDDALSSLMVVAVSAEDGTGKTVERAVACGMSLVRVKDKIVYLYVYRHYTDDASLDWVKRTAEKWVNETLAAN